MLTKSSRNQKLSDSQILTIKYLNNAGIRIAVIANVLKASYGVSKCVAYYHLSRIEKQQPERLALKAKITEMVQSGLTTGKIATILDMPLAEVNKIYIR